MSTNLNFKYVENLKKPGRYTDALVRGLHLWVKPNLNKYWIFRYSQKGKQQNLSLGPYPLVSIAEARILAQQVRDKIRLGINPIKERQNTKDEATSKAKSKISFRDFAIECIPKKVKRVVHHKAMHYKQIPSFISQLRESDNMAALALEFTILNGARSGEVFGGLKSEIQDGLWVIPASRMKAKKEHRVPLSQRSLDLLAIASAIAPGSKYLFSRKGKPLSNMAMSMILRRMKLNVTTHGFRSTFRDWISEQTHFSSEVAEMSLAHTIANKIEAAYRRQDLLEKRRALLVAWEVYCSSNQKNNIHQLKAA